jgi:hypothetical protein
VRGRRPANCYISGFADGIHISGASQAYPNQVYITDTVVSNNETGIFVRTFGYQMLVALLRVQMNNNLSWGLYAGAGTHIAVTDSKASNNGVGVFAYSTNLIINRSAIVNNASSGVATWFGNVIVGNSTIAGNGTGLDVSATYGGAILTNGNNSLVGNFMSNGTFSGPSPLK